MRHIIFSLLSFILSSVVYSQIVSSVVATVSFGEYYYSILVDENQDVYKTSKHEVGELLIGDILILGEADGEWYPIYQDDVELSILASMIGGRSNSFDVFRNDVLPEVEDSILKFRDRDHFLEVYDLIDFVLSDTNSILEFDEKLDSIEVGIFGGYNSFRTFFNGKFNWLDGEFRSDEMEEISALDFIGDDILKTMLNHTAQVVIGDSIYSYLGHDIVFGGYYDEDIQNLLTNLFYSHDLGKYDLFEPTSLCYPENLVLYSSFCTSETKATVTGTNGYNYQSIVKTARESCDYHTFKIQVQIIYQGYVGGESILNDSNEGVSNVSLIIDWGDGSSIQTIQNYTSQGVTHYYTTPGTYYPKTTIAFNHYGGFVSINDGTNTTNTTNYPLGAATSGAPIEFVSWDACTNGDYQKQTWPVQGSWKMETKTWINDMWIFGSKIGGYTHSWYYQNGSWKRKKANISAQVHGEFRDNSCIMQEVKDGFNHNNGDKKIQVTKSKTFANRQMGGQYSNWSKHNLHENGANIWWHTDIDPCQ